MTGDGGVAQNDTQIPSRALVGEQREHALVYDGRRRPVEHGLRLRRLAVAVHVEFESKL